MPIWRRGLHRLPRQWHRAPFAFPTSSPDSSIPSLQISPLSQVGLIPVFLYSFHFPVITPIQIVPISKVKFKSFLLQKAFLMWNVLKVSIISSAKLSATFLLAFCVCVCTRLCKFLNRRLRYVEIQLSFSTIYLIAILGSHVKLSKKSKLYHFKENSVTSNVFS